MEAADGNDCLPPSIPLLVIAGPTATRKTEMALRIAERLGGEIVGPRCGEIISADSMQIYRRLDAGTSKPTAEERARAPIHLIDFVEPDDPYTVADFQRDARRVIEEIHARGNLPILCGGTGLYIRAVLQGFAFPRAEDPCEQETRHRLQTEAEADGVAALHERLRQVDPVAADRIGPADTRRIIRALEVFEMTGRPISELQRVDAPSGLRYNAAYFVLSCPRPALYRRIEARVDAMLASGWLEEVRGLAEQGYPSSLQSLQAIGYRRLLEFLRGVRGWEETVGLIKQDTRRFAKRQETWFRREPQARWLVWENETEFDALERTIAIVAARLGKNR
jgi:tRNA dimethylallyltransferase